MNTIYKIFFLILFSVNTLNASSDIAVPEYDGVDQLLFLSNKWIVIVTNNTEDVLKEIDRLTNGEYFQKVQAWEKSKDSNSPNWTALKGYEALYKKQAGEARKNIGELEMDGSAYYSIDSSTDENYKSPLNPGRVTRFITSLGGPLIPGEYILHYAHYCYLEMPHSLKNGNSYCVTLQNGKKVSFLYDDLKTISRAIKVNQVGYLPDCENKFAYLGCYLHEFGPMDCDAAKKFYVINAQTGEKVIEGTPKLRAYNPHVGTKPGSNENPNNKPLLTGEDTYEIDLSALKIEGDFFISIPGFGRSWVFSHTNDVYASAFYIAARGLYHQRCGIEVGSPFTKWPRQKCHNDPVFESEAVPFTLGMESPKNFNRFDVIGKTLSQSTQTDDTFGGWHDAADWDRNIFHYTNILDLLYAYEINPEKFTDGQLNIPESGNGIPDILDEAKWGLMAWEKSMDSNGGVAGLIETSTHPSIDDPNFPYAYSQRTRFASLLYAGAAAQFAHLVKPFNAKLALEYEESAMKAYSFGKNQDNSLGKITIHAATQRGKGEPYEIEWEEKDEYNFFYEIYANLRLFILTDDKNYLEDIPNLLSKIAKPSHWWRGSMRDYSQWLYFSLFSTKVKQALKHNIINEWENDCISFANDLVKHSLDQPYRQSWPIYRDFWMSWGSTTMTNQARVLFIAYILTQDQKFLNAAINNVDYMLGVNPMGISWTTGLGTVYPIDIQHGPSIDDGIYDPVPGITIYGITEAVFHDLKLIGWQANDINGQTIDFLKNANREIPIFRRWSCHPSRNTPQCEFTIHETMSSTIFSTAMLMSEKWMPPEELKKKEPKEEKDLSGYWFLP